MAEQRTPAELSAERQASWKAFVDIVIRYRLGRRAEVVEYLRGIEKAKGRAVAEATKQSIRLCALAEKWADVQSWPANGYRFKPAAVAAKGKK
jgi:hypothetical protein